jgi:hypothetical protein
MVATTAISDGRGNWAISLAHYRRAATDPSGGYAPAIHQINVSVASGYAAHAVASNAWAMANQFVGRSDAMATRAHIPRISPA